MSNYAVFYISIRVIKSFHKIINPHFLFRYKESITKSTRGWKERFFSRNNTMAADLGTEVRREVNTGISTVSHVMERLETRDSNSDSTTSVSSCSNNSVPELINQQISETAGTNPMNATNVQASCAASSSSN